MGTNYYLVTRCKYCGNILTKEHLGKQSSGNPFLLAVTALHPDLESVIDHVRESRDISGAEIEDEYEEKIELPEFIRIVDTRKNADAPKSWCTMSCEFC